MSAQKPTFLKAKNEEDEGVEGEEEEEEEEEIDGEEEEEEEEEAEEGSDDKKAGEGAPSPDNSKSEAESTQLPQVLAPPNPTQSPFMHLRLIRREHTHRDVCHPRGAKEKRSFVPTMNDFGCKWRERL